MLEIEAVVAKTGAQPDHCVLLLLLATLAQAPPWAQSRPNIVIIMVDDAGLIQAEPFGAYAKMPTIQKLATQGVRFTQHRRSRCAGPPAPYCQPASIIN